jgi:Mn2+/Fe2+ NRAMP family transporter
VNSPAPQASSKKGRSDTELLLAARGQAGPRKFWTYFRLLGPGWLQSGLKLGGGTMTSSLYIGLLSGFTLLWVHPLAMLLGIIMLWALGYVIMNTGLRPFRAITDHVNPVLGWGWVIAALLSSMVWDLPQYAMAHGALAQNLLPSIFGANGLLGDFGGRLGVSILVLALCTTVTWSYDHRGVGLRFFDVALQALVWIKTLAFVGVVIRLAISESVAWGDVFRGLFIPDLALLDLPAKSYEKLLGPLTAGGREYWSALLVDKQRDLIIASAATAAGVNGTFLFGYSVWRRKWGKEFLMFSRLDLIAGMLLPVTITSSCVVIAGAHQFHTVYQAALISQEPGAKPPPAKRVAEYNELLRGRVLHAAAQSNETLSTAEIESLKQVLPIEEKRVAAAVVTRDAFELAASLEPLTGPFIAHFVFGFGVLGMCFSSIILHMTVCGMIFCEMRNVPHTGWTYKLGSLAASVGALGPFLWSKAAFWLAIPVAVFSYTLIPLTYITFFTMMNSRSLLGDALPRGGRRWAWNLAMGVSVAFFCASSAWMLWHNGGYWGYVACGAFLLAAGIVQIVRRRRPAVAAEPRRLEPVSPR